MYVGMILLSLLVHSNTAVPVAMKQLQSNEPTSCGNVCVAEIVRESSKELIALKNGEKIIDPSDPCNVIHCSETNFTIYNETVECEDIKSCADGGAPYYVNGHCCPSCDFNGGSNGTHSGTWSSWSSWTQCSKTCGSGRRTRERKCNTANRVTVNCTGDALEIGDCSTNPCPVDGGWTDWSVWGQCSVTCSSGSQTRRRTCTNPAPAHGGKDCEGNSVERRTCFSGHCPRNCVWLVWSKWSNCSSECGSGVQVRRRMKIPEAYGGKPCIGKESEQRVCNTHECPVNGGWSEWSDWSNCTVTCNNGTQTRSRQCNNPEPKHGGEDCIGIMMETRVCQQLPCPDPCKENDCFTGVQCTRINDTAYNCGSCPQGLTGDGKTCLPVNECLVDNPCFTSSMCTDLERGFYCSPCPSGYTGNSYMGFNTTIKQNCTDIDECAVNNGGCHSARTCNNSEGSFTCSDCSAGFNNVGDDDCEVDDPCLAGVNECDAKATCTRTGKGTNNCECPFGTLGNGKQCIYDSDFDGFPDFPLTIGCDELHCPFDNCPTVPNSGQENTDGDAFGDACDTDKDSDGVLDTRDNCVYIANPDQTDSDGDGIGNVCDNCPEKNNKNQQDTDGDGIGDPCDLDEDEDGVVNDRDNCPFVKNPSQHDLDGDGRGDACDNCRKYPNANQLDEDENEVGDACQGSRDTDGDGIYNNEDNCLYVANADQIDSDGDYLGDACDIDDDNDRILDMNDNCPLVRNPDQADRNGNGVGDLCEGDSDGDGVPNHIDVCPHHKDIHKTDFRTYKEIALDPKGRAQIDPIWKVFDEGAEVTQTANSDPGLLLGKDKFSSFEFNGTFHVAEGSDDDFAGIVFNYQSNKKFIVVTWKRGPQEYWNRKPFLATARAGIEVKVVSSQSGPGPKLRNSLWHSGNTPNELKTIWSDPAQKGWDYNTAYRWNLVYSTNTDCMSLRFYEGATRLIDTGCLCDLGVKGGKLGMFGFSQERVTWSNMKYKCLDTSTSHTFCS